MNTYPDWITWVVAFSVLAGALSIIVRKIIRPLLRMMIVAEDVTPVLRQIASDFPNGHLKMRIEHLTSQFTTLANQVNTLSSKVDGNTQAIDKMRTTLEERR